jgi:hypothetical protein
MKKSPYIMVLTLTTLLVVLFAAYSPGTVTAAIITPSIDTHKMQYASTASGATLTISTSVPQEIIYATIYSKNSGNVLSVSSTPSLTWHSRGSLDVSGTGEIDAWWALVSTPQSVTVSFSSSGNTGGCVMTVFSVKGADPTAPFDPNLPNAVFNSGNSGTASASVTTTNANDLIVGVLAVPTKPTKTAGTGYTEIDNTGTSNSPSGSDEYKTVSAKGTYTPTFTFSSGKWIEAADAFVPASQSITITSSPPVGAGFITVNGTAQTTPYTANWAPGTVLALSAAGTVSGGTGKQYVYTGWSDSGAQTHTYTVQSASETLTANYQTQYQITFTQTGLDSSTAAGTVLTVNGTAVQYSGLPYSVWVNSGDRLVYTYAATVSSTTSGKQFALGTLTPSSPLVGIASAQTVTANYQAQYQATFTQSGLDSSTATGTILTVNGTNVQYSALPYNVWVNSGDRLVYTYSGTMASTTNGKQFTLTTTSPSSPLVGINSKQTVTANYQTQYQLTFTTNPSAAGSIDHANGYYNTGTTSITATAAGGYHFDHWSSDSGVSFDNSASAATTVTVSGAAIVTANFDLDSIPTTLTIATNSSSIEKGTVLRISGTLTGQEAGISGKTVTISLFNVTEWVTLGTAQTQADGTYQYDWHTPVDLTNGPYYLKADFAGDTPYLPSTSTVAGNNLSLMVLPEYEFGGIIGIAACFAAMALFLGRKKVAQKLKK